MLELHPTQEQKEFSFASSDNRVKPLSKKSMFIILRYCKSLNFFKEYDFFEVRQEKGALVFYYHQLLDDLLKSLPKNYDSIKKITNISNLISQFKMDEFITNNGVFYIVSVWGRPLNEIQELENKFDFLVHGKNLRRRGEPRYCLKFSSELRLFTFLTKMAKMFTRIDIKII